MAIVDLSGPGKALDAVRLASGASIAIGALFIAPRTQMASVIPAQLGCIFDNAPTGPIVLVDGSKTTVPGVYAAGDICSPMWNVTLAAAAAAGVGVGVGVGVGAGVAAHQSLVFG